MIWGWLNVRVSEVLYSDISIMHLQNRHCVSQVLSVEYQLVNRHCHCCCEPKERRCREIRYKANRICPFFSWRFRETVPMTLQTRNEEHSLRIVFKIFDS